MEITKVPERKLRGATGHRKEPDRWTYHEHVEAAPVAWRLAGWLLRQT